MKFKLHLLSHICMTFISSSILVHKSKLEFSPTNRETNILIPIQLYKHENLQTIKFVSLTLIILFFSTSNLVQIFRSILYLISQKRVKIYDCIKKIIREDAAPKYVLRVLM